MHLVIVSFTVLLCSVSANPTPQIFGYQPATPVGQWVSNNLQSSLQSVANAIQSISRPSQATTGPNPQIVPIGPNQIPNGPDSYNYGPVQTVVQPVPVQTVSVQPIPYQPGPYQPGPYQPGPYQPSPYQPGPYQPGPYQPGPYEQIHIVPVPPNAQWPNGMPYRQNDHQNDQSSKSSNWIPVPLYSQFGEPTIIIISRPPSKPAHQNETVLHENATHHQNHHPTNATNVHTDMAANATTTTFSQNEQTYTPTPVPAMNYGTTSMFSPENGMNVPELGLSMVNRVPITSTQTINDAMPNTN